MSLLSVESAGAAQMRGVLVPGVLSLIGLTEYLSQDSVRGLEDLVGVFGTMIAVALGVLCGHPLYRSPAASFGPGLARVRRADDHRATGLRRGALGERGRVEACSGMEMNAVHVSSLREPASEFPRACGAADDDRPRCETPGP